VTYDFSGGGAPSFTASGGFLDAALTVTEIYTSYITNEISGATETIKGVNISKAGD
jgi:hypothetical protein